MGKLEDMERAREQAHRRQKKEKKRQREAGKDEVVRDEVDEPKVQKDGTEDIPKSQDLERQQGVPEEQTYPINRKSASHLLVQVPTPPRQPIDSDTDVGPRQEAPNHQEGDSDKRNTLSSVTSPVLPMFSTGPRLTQGRYLVCFLAILKF
jgi:hypothetical protein